MAQTEMLTIKRGYDFSKWLLQHTGKFPRSHRFSVAVKLENAILDFIEHASVANTRQNKLPLLKEADEALVNKELSLLPGRKSGPRYGADGEAITEQGDKTTCQSSWNPINW